MPQAIKAGILGVMLLILAGITTQGKPFPQHFDKARYYEVIGKGSIPLINEELEILKNTAHASKEAYEGALFMKKAGLVKGAQKLHLFKSGRLKLETSIKEQSDNAELRFLRILIQEHAPKIVNYRGDLEKDREMVKHAFNGLAPVVQKAILDYSKQSAVISEKEL